MNVPEKLLKAWKKAKKLKKNPAELAQEIAAKTGSAVGVGHDRVNTVRVLGRIIPELKTEGFQFVYLSEMVKPR